MSADDLEGMRESEQADRLERAADKSDEAAERTWEAVSILSAMAGRMQQPTSNAAITINGASAWVMVCAAVAILFGVASTVFGVAAVWVASSNVATLRHQNTLMQAEMHKLQERSDLHQAYVESIERRISQPKE